MEKTIQKINTRVSLQEICNQIYLSDCVTVIRVLNKWDQSENSQRLSLKTETRIHQDFQLFIKNGIKNIDYIKQHITTEDMDFAEAILENFHFFTLPDENGRQNEIKVNYLKSLSDSVKSKINSLENVAEKLEAVKKVEKFFPEGELMKSTLDDILKNNLTEKNIEALIERVDMGILVSNISEQPIKTIKDFEKKFLEKSEKSLLKTALDSNSPESVIRLVKNGFKLTEEEKTAARAEDILNSNSFIFRMFGYGPTKNDELRMVVMSNAKENKDINLSNKPSPLYLAIETKQPELAMALIGMGLELKREELIEYKIAKEKSFMEIFFANNQSKEEVKNRTQQKIEDIKKKRSDHSSIQPSL